MSEHFDFFSYNTIDFTNKDVYVFSHVDCFDGTVAAYLVEDYAKQDGAKSVQIVYGGYNKERLVLPAVNPVDTIVFIVDYSFNDIVDLVTILEQGITVAWFDHHPASHALYKQLMTLYGTLPDNLILALSDSESGAMLTADYFYGVTVHPSILLATFIDDHDRHIHQYPDTKLVCRLLGMYGLNDTNSVAKVMNDYIRPYYIYQRELNQQQTKEQIRLLNEKMEAKLLDYDLFRKQTLSLLADSVVSVTLGTDTFHACFAPRAYRGELCLLLMERFGVDVAAVLTITSKEVVISLRSQDNGKAREIAMKWGGEGHPNAAGCKVSLMYTFFNHVQ